MSGPLSGHSAHADNHHAHSSGMERHNVVGSKTTYWPSRSETPTVRPMSALSYSSGPRRLPMGGGARARPHSALGPQSALRTPGTSVTGAHAYVSFDTNRQRPQSAFASPTPSHATMREAAGMNLSPRRAFEAEGRLGIRSPITAAFNQRGSELLKMYESADEKRRKSISASQGGKSGTDVSALLKNFDTTFDSVSRLLASQRPTRDSNMDDTSAGAQGAEVGGSGTSPTKRAGVSSSAVTRRLAASSGEKPVPSVARVKSRNLDAIIASINERREKHFDPVMEDLDDMEPTDALRALRRRGRWSSDNSGVVDHLRRNKERVSHYSNKERNKELRKSARALDKRIVANQRRCQEQQEARKEAIYQDYVQKMNREYYTALRNKQEQALQQHVDRKIKWTAMSHVMKRMHWLQKRLDYDRKVREKRKSMKWAVTTIGLWYSRLLRKKRMERSKGLVSVLMYHLRRWVKKMQKIIRKEAAHRLVDFLEDMQNSNKVVFMVRTFRQRVLSIQAVWHSTINIRHAQHKLAILQWQRFEGILRGGEAARNARLLLSGEGRGKGFLSLTERMALEFMRDKPALSATLGVRVPRDIKEIVVGANLVQQRKDVISQLPVYAELLEVYKAQLQLDDVRRSLFQNLGNFTFAGTAVKPARPRVFAISNAETMLRLHMDGVSLANARKAETAIIEKATADREKKVKKSRLAKVSTIKK